MRALALVLALGGCAAGLPPQETTCDAGNWQALVGQPEAALYGTLGNLRIIRPGEAVTDDLNPDRLNAFIGADGRITGFECY